MNTLQKELFFCQAERTFGETSRSRVTAELLALLGDEHKERNERDALKKMKRKPFGSTVKLLALLGIESKSGFLSIN